MIVRIPTSFALIVAIFPSVRADDFDRLEGRPLAALPKSAEAISHDALSVSEIGNLARIFKGVRSGVLVVQSGEGNLARLIVSAALRRPPGHLGVTKQSERPDKTAEPVPILILERFDTFEAGPATTRLARGRDVPLFDGFLYDLDTGAVVPEGQGGDLRFSSKEGGRLMAVGGAKLFTLARSPLPSGAEPGRPSPGKAIVPGDFAGRYHLIGDGQWSGRLDLEVAEGANMTGQFRSDQTGQTYKVAGQVQPDAPGHLLFAIQFPRSRQEYDARLWTGGKGAMSGTVSLLDGTYGFLALRDGAKLEPEGAVASP